MSARTPEEKSGGLCGKFEDMMSAISFAEAGEHETARQMLKEHSGKVLLAAREGQSNSNAFKYALGVCRRIGAQLEVLFVSQKSSPTGMNEFMPQLKASDVQWKVSSRTGCLKNQIIDYTQSNDGIMFVVTESSDSLDVDCRRKSGRLNEAWQNLRCPLVVVSAPESA